MSHNTWTHRLARVAVRPLVGSPITPNHLTTLRLVTGLAAIAALAVGSPAANNWGGLLFVLSCFLDRADGELARIGGKTSRWGHVYDLACDGLIAVLVFVGIGIGLSRGPLGSVAVVMGIVAGLAVGLIFWLVTRVEATGEEAFAGTAGFDPDDVFYLVGPLAWLGWLAPFLIAASVGAPVFAAWGLWRYRALVYGTAK